MVGNPHFNKPGNSFVRAEDGTFLPGHPGFVALKIEPDEFYRLGMEFCDICEETKRTPTIAGLCRHLGISMKTYYNYCKRDDMAFECESVQMRIVEVWEARLIGSGTAGAQFWLRNNAGYKDMRQTELSGPNGEPIQSVTSVEIVGVDAPQLGLDPDAL